MRRIRRRLFIRRDLEGRPLYIMIPAASRDRQHWFLDPSTLADFDGDDGWFEIEVLPGGRLSVLRRIDGPLAD